MNLKLDSVLSSIIELVLYSDNVLMFYVPGSYDFTDGPVKTGIFTSLHRNEEGLHIIV